MPKAKLRRILPVETVKPTRALNLDEKEILKDAYLFNYTDRMTIFRFTKAH